MKICFLANPASSHTQKWVEHFCRGGDEVHLICFEDADEIVPQATVHRLNAKLGPFRYFAAAGQVKKILKSVEPDLLHAHYAAGYGTLGRLSGFHPFIVSVWGSDVFEVPDRSHFHEHVIKSNLASADHVCSTSHFMAKRARQYYQGPLTVTPFGVDCERFRPLSKLLSSEDEFVIGTVKLLEDKYGIDYLIRAFAVLKQNYGPRKTLRLVIAGDGSRRRELQKLASSCGVSRETEFLGFVAHKDVPSVLNTFSVFAALSVTQSETFGVAVIEASACGIPVVVSDAGGLPEVVKNRFTGTVVRRRDPEAAAAAFGDLIEHPDRSLEMGQAGRKFVLEQYEWTENASRMERIYELVAGVKLNKPVTAQSFRHSENISLHHG
jgi:L-malate glycosyltransferase